MTNEIRHAGQQALGILGDARFWWGVLVTLITAVITGMAGFGQWSRADERMQADIRSNTAQLAVLTSEFRIVAERVPAIGGDLRAVMERVARLEARREEDDKQTQARALTEAQWRAEMSYRIQSYAEQLGHLRETVARLEPPRETPRRQTLRVEEIQPDAPMVHAGAPDRKTAADPHHNANP